MHLQPWCAYGPDSGSLFIFHTLSVSLTSLWFQRPVSSPSGVSGVLLGTDPAWGPWREVWKCEKMTDPPVDRQHSYLIWQAECRMRTHCSEFQTGNSIAFNSPKPLLPPGSPGWGSRAPEVQPCQTCSDRMAGLVRK